MASSFSVSGLVGDTGDLNDWYEFVVAGTQAVNIELIQPYIDSSLLVYNASLSSIASANSGAQGWVDEVLQPGTYYVEVAPIQLVPYSLQIATGAPAVGTSSSDTAGQTLLGASSLGTISTPPQTIEGYIGGTDTADYYSFNVAATSNVVATLSGLSAVDNFFLYNPSGTVLLSGTKSNSSNLTLNAWLAPLASGSYYLEVTGSSSSQAGYSLSVSATPSVPKYSTALANPTNIGTLSSATQTFSDSLNSVTYAEYFNFNLAADSQIDANLSGLVNTATLTLENSNGSLIESSVGYSERDATLLEDLAANAPGTYYVLEVDTGTQYTPFTLSVSAPPIGNTAGTIEAAAQSLGALGNTPITVTAPSTTLRTPRYYSFVLGSAATVNAQLAVAFAGDSNSASMSLYNSSNHVILSSSSGTDVMDSVALQAGTYYLEVITNENLSPDDYTLTLTTGVAPVGTSSSHHVAATSPAAVNGGTLTAAGTSYADWVGPGNTDEFYQFTVAKTSSVLLNLTGVAAGASVLASLENANLTVIGNSTASQTLDGVVWSNVSPGTYYIDVHDNYATLSTGFNLAVSATPVVQTGGSTQSTALNIGALSTTQNYSGFVAAIDTTNGLPAFDTDNYFEFTLAVNSIVSVDVSSEQGVYAKLDDLTSVANDQGDGSIVQALTAGTYFLDIASEGNAADYSFSIGANVNADSAGSSQATADVLGTIGTSSVTPGGGSSTVDAGSGGTSFTVPTSTSYVTTEGANTIYAAAGTPTVSAPAGSPLVFGEASSLYFIGGAGSATVVGGSADNTVVGGAGNLVLFAISQTNFTAGTGAATVVGGTGAITASLGQGGGEIFGGSGGGNVLSSASSSTSAVSYLVGNGNGDLLQASGPGTAYLVAGSGAETLNASQASGTVGFFGNTGNDIFTGGGGANYFVAGSGNATLTGGTGTNVFFGGSGAESITSGPGTNYYLIGTGNETINAGSGYNYFFYGSATTPRTDTITNFAAAPQLFILTPNTAATNAAAVASATTNSSGTSFTLQDGTTIVLPGVSGITTSSFLS